MQLTPLNKDCLGAALLVALGSAVVVMGIGYGVGSPSRMGAGFVPVLIGALLVVVGVLIGTVALLSRPIAPVGVGVGTGAEAAGDGHAPSGLPDARGACAVLGGVVAFTVLGQFGLVPASFAAVFIAALGDRGNGPLQAAALAAGITAFGVAVFHYGLRLQLPLFAGPLAGT